MSFQDQMYRYLEQAEREMQENERMLGSFREIEPRLAELVGEGFGAEDKVRATWTQRGLQDLELDPRALRLTSEILAREIKAAIAESIEDLRRQTMAVIESLGVATPQMPDPAEAQAQLARFREEMMGAFKVSAQELDRAHRLRQQYDSTPGQDEGGQSPSR